MTTDPLSPLPGAVRQNGYVVRDLDRSIAAWLELGVGPWTKLPPAAYEMQYRGATITPELAIAFANSDELQIELIQQLDDGPSIYREFLDAGNEGFHHLAWWADDYDAFLAAADAAEWSAVYSGDSGGIARFCYFDNPRDSSTCIEVMELNALTGWMMSKVRDSARDWDGSDPVRGL